MSGNAPRSPHDHLTITSSSSHHHLTITPSSSHHHLTITPPPPHHLPTITSPSPHDHLITISPPTSSALSVYCFLRLQNQNLKTKNSLDVFGFALGVEGTGAARHSTFACGQCWTPVAINRAGGTGRCGHEIGNCP